MLPAILLGWLVWYLIQLDAGRHASIVVVDGSDQELTDVRVELFEYADAAHSPSPTRKLGEHAIDAPGAHRLPTDLVPGEALARVTAPGLGVGYAYLAAGRSPERVKLEPGVRLEGRALLPNGAPAAGARVVAFGGGARGVPLTEAVVDPAGTFVVDGVAPSTDSVLLRVFAEGCAIRDEARYLYEEEALVIRLRPSRPLSGRVVSTDPAVPRERFGTAKVRVYALPGVETDPDAEGRFELRHLPTAPTRCVLLLPDLPTDLTHRRVQAQEGDADVVLTVERAATLAGVVLDRTTGDAVPNAIVSHEHGPHGIEAVKTDRAGRFVLTRVPPGTVELRASVRFGIGEKTRFGAGQLAAEAIAGERTNGLVLHVD